MKGCDAVMYIEGAYGIHGCMLEEGHEGKHVCYKPCCDVTWEDEVK